MNFHTLDTGMLSLLYVLPCGSLEHLREKILFHTFDTWMLSVLYVFPCPPLDHTHRWCIIACACVLIDCSHIWHWNVLFPVYVTMWVFRIFARVNDCSHIWHWNALSLVCTHVKSLDCINELSQIWSVFFTSFSALSLGGWDVLCKAQI